MCILIPTCYRQKKLKSWMIRTLGLSLLSGTGILMAAPVILNVISTPIHVDGFTKEVYNIVQSNGFWGYTGIEGQNFNVIVRNQTNVPTAIHWHGLIVPNREDGVPGVTQAPIKPGQSMQYQFLLVQSGTYWMHSHEGLQSQDLMAAPLIILNPKSRYPKDQQVVMLLEDFTRQNPEAILKSLHDQAAKMPMTMPAAKTAPDLNDVHYDAFLTNRKTLQQPDIIRVTPNSWIRLRIIDGAAGSNFWIHPGLLDSQAIAFDGQDIQPLQESQYQIAMGQRIDLQVHIPASGGAFPILAQVEGTHFQTGLILATPHAMIPAEMENISSEAPALNNQQEEAMKALHPLPSRPITQHVNVILSGDMMKYHWQINGQSWPHITPIQIPEGARVEMVFQNETGMAHPMHLHGNVFELVAINQHPMIDGPLHDTLLILPHTTDTVIFDADHPGNWVMHCHMAYHQASGMMTLVKVVPAQST